MVILSYHLGQFYLTSEMIFSHLKKFEAFFEPPTYPKICHTLMFQYENHQYFYEAIKKLQYD